MNRFYGRVLVVCACACAAGSLPLTLGCGAASKSAEASPMMASRAASGGMAPTMAPGAQSVGAAERDGDGVGDVAGKKESFDEPKQKVADNRPVPPAPPGGPTGASGGQPQPPRVVADAPHATSMLIYTAAINLAVFQVEQQMIAVEKLAREAGGYLATRGDQQITIRIPRGQFDDVIKRIEQLGDVTHRSITAQDVTDEYVDLEIRIKNARAMRDRLQELLKQAAVKDALEIEKELGRITGEIERMEGRLKLLKDKIAYSTITVTFAPVDSQPVRDQTILPFPWLQDFGLSSLLNVHP